MKNKFVDDVTDKVVLKLRDSLCRKTANTAIVGHMVSQNSTLLDLLYGSLCNTRIIDSCNKIYIWARFLKN